MTDVYRIVIVIDLNILFSYVYVDFWKSKSIDGWCRVFIDEAITRQGILSQLSHKLPVNASS